MTLRSPLLVLVGTLLLWATTPLGAEQVHPVDIIVGGRTVHALCTTGPRRVVLLHGEVGSAESWRPVLERLSGSVGACAYDRFGKGVGRHRSPRGWFELMDELQAVHATLGLHPRYVLVGHSIGGMYARLYSADRPGEVGGLILVDPTHEDMPAAVVPGMPESVRLSWIQERGRPNIDGVREIDLDARARRGRLPDIPVSVLTAMVRQDGDGWDARFLSQAARRVHASVLRGVHSARHIPASGSGHQVPLEAPDLVAGEIIRMVRTTQGPAR